jgi:hypothetical protein
LWKYHINWSIVPLFVLSKIEQFIWFDYYEINSLYNNKGITDKSVPVLKVMLQSSHITNELFVISSFSVLSSFLVTNENSWFFCEETSISASNIAELKIERINKGEDYVNLNSKYVETIILLFEKKK